MGFFSYLKVCFSSGGSDDFSWGVYWVWFAVNKYKKDISIALLGKGSSNKN